MHVGGPAFRTPDEDVSCENISPWVRIPQIAGEAKRVARHRDGFEIGVDAMTNMEAGGNRSGAVEQQVSRVMKENVGMETLPVVQAGSDRKQARVHRHDVHVTAALPARLPGSLATSRPRDAISTLVT
jgi:hypothetical protein